MTDKDKDKHTEDIDPALWRGVFVAPVERKILFTKKIRLDLKKLPRRDPKVILGDEYSDVREED